MKVILYMAMSVNGIIAHDNEGQDFLSSENWDTLRKLAKKYKTIVVGRKTYEIVRGWGPEYNFDEFKGVKKFILTTNKGYKADPGYILAESTEAVLAIAEHNRYKDVLVIGGCRTCCSFLRIDFVDEIIINIEPVIVGRGIPLVYPENFDKRLKLIAISKLKNGIVSLRYKVLRK